MIPLPHKSELCSIVVIACKTGRFSPPWKKMRRRLFVVVFAYPCMSCMVLLDVRARESSRVQEVLLLCFKLRTWCEGVSHLFSPLRWAFYSQQVLQDAHFWRLHLCKGLFCLHIDTPAEHNPHLAEFWESARSEMVFLLGEG